MSENEKNSTQGSEISEIPAEVMKKSYLERAIYTYLKKYFSEGYKRLIERQNAFFFYYCIVIIITMIVSSVIYALKYNIPESIVQLFIYWGLTTAAALILGGLIGGAVKKRLFLNILTISLMVGALILTILQSKILPISLNLSYNMLFLQWVKAFYFISFACISSLSMFSIIWSFHTSFTYRFVNLGNSPNRMFMQGILRLGGWVAIALNVYLVLQNSWDARIIGIIGILISLSLVVRMYRLPQFEKNDDGREKDYKTARISFCQILGFFNLYLVYRLSQSFKTGGSISNLTMDLILLAINTFYMINVLIKKVNLINRTEDEHRVFLFQRDTGFLRWIKRSFDEKGLIFCMLGLALGYHSAYMDSFLPSSINLIDIFTNTANLTPPNVIYHRTYLFLAYLLILSVMIAFSSSRKVQRMALNRFSIRHIMDMFKDMFRVSEDGTAGVVLETVELGKQKITEQVDKVKTQMKKGLRRFFSLGGSSHDESK